MENIKKCVFWALAAAFTMSLIISAQNASAAKSLTYKDFSEIPSQQELSYANSNIYWASNTTVTVVRAAGKHPVAGSDPVEYTDVEVGDKLFDGYQAIHYIDEGQTLDVLIENSTAKDSGGNPVDVLMRISDVHRWIEGYDDSGLIKSYAILETNNTANGSMDSSTESLSPGDPIMFWNELYYADSLFTIKYCVKDSYNTDDHDCTAAGISGINMALWDFDVPNGNESYQDKEFYGNEGIKPFFRFNENVVMYYNKNNPDPDGNIIMRIDDLSGYDTGFWVKNINLEDYNGISYYNSVFVTASNLSDASWSYRYSGTSCGISFAVDSPVPYKLPNPTKEADKPKAKKGDKITYTITQEIPYNYSSDASSIVFTSLYSSHTISDSETFRYDNIHEKKNFGSFRIVDDLDENLAPIVADIVVKDESDNELTSIFKSSVDGNTLTLSANNVDNENLYGHTLTVTVPVNVVGDASAASINNAVETKYTLYGDSADGDDKVTTLTSDEPATTGVQHSIRVVFIDDETGEEIAGGYTITSNHGDEYETSGLAQIPEGYVLVETPDNAASVANSNATIVYRYKKITNPSTLDMGLGSALALIASGIIGSIIYIRMRRRR